jgi:hypothetical protein
MNIDTYVEHQMGFHFDAYRSWEKRDGKIEFIPKDYINSAFFFKWATFLFQFNEFVYFHIWNMNVDFIVMP